MNILIDINKKVATAAMSKNWQFDDDGNIEYGDEYVATASEASQKAKSMGLRHLGFGKYVAEDGKKFTTKNGELTEDGHTANDTTDDNDGDDDPTDSEDDADDSDETDEGDSDNEPTEEIADRDANDQSTRQNSENLPVVVPDNHRPIFDISTVPSGSLRSQHPQDERNMIQNMQNSSTELAVIDNATPIRLSRTQELVGAIKNHFGATLSNYKEAIDGVAQDIKDLKPFREGGPPNNNPPNSNWEFDDDGNAVDPEGAEKALYRKKLVGAIGMLTLGAVGLVVLGPFAGIAMYAVAAQLSEKYCRDLDEQAGRTDADNNNNGGGGSNRGNQRYMQPSNNRQRDEFLRNRNRNNLQYDNDDYEDETRRRHGPVGTSSPVQMRNRNYGRRNNNFDPYSNNYDPYYNSYASANDQQLDSNLAVIVDSYKVWLKQINLQAVFDEAKDLYGHDTTQETIHD